MWVSLPFTLHSSRAVKALANTVKRSSQQMWLKSKDPLWSTHWLKPAHWSDLKWLGAEIINNVEVHKWLRVNYMSWLHPVFTQSVTIILWKEECWKGTEKTASRSSSPNPNLNQEAIEAKNLLNATRLFILTKTVCGPLLLLTIFCGSSCTFMNSLQIPQPPLTV